MEELSIRAGNYKKVDTYVPRTSFIVYLSSTVGVLFASPLLEDEDPDLPDFPPSAPFLLPKRGMVAIYKSF